MNISEVEGRTILTIQEKDETAGDKIVKGLMIGFTDGTYIVIGAPDLVWRFSGDRERLREAW